MNFSESMTISLRNLTSNKVRSALTMLGIIIGVMSIVLLISVVAGTQDKIESEVKSMGSNVLLITPGNSEEMHGPPGTMSVNRFKLKFIELIETRSSFGVKACPVYVNLGSIVKYKNKSKTSVMVAGTYANFPYVRNWNIGTGSYFRDEDVRASRKVCVVGETVVKDIFGGNDPIGKELTVAGNKLRITGITEKKGRTMGQDNDNIVAMPITTMHEILGTEQINQIIVKVPDPAKLTKAVSEIKKVLLTQLDRQDFSVKSSSELLNTFLVFTGILSVVMGCVASIALFVGGIGIMNIMLVTVKERTREIGIRKAVGATYKDILFQFITEAVLLSVTGGLIGIIISVSLISGVMAALGDIMPMPLNANTASIIIAFVCSTAIGVFFGTYPAVKAAKTDPITALRYE
ncbi:MAG: ABC transporter permease [Candidatus Firestonebacteria bacterium]